MNKNTWTVALESCELLDKVIATSMGTCIAGERIWAGDCLVVSAEDGKVYRGCPTPLQKLQVDSSLMEWTVEQD